MVFGQIHWFAWAQKKSVLAVIYPQLEHPTVIRRLILVVYTLESMFFWTFSTRSSLWD
jgi:hypothetical protein